MNIVESTGISSDVPYLRFIQSGPQNFQYLQSSTVLSGVCLMVKLEGNQRGDLDVTNVSRCKRLLGSDRITLDAFRVRLQRLKKDETLQFKRHNWNADRIAAWLKKKNVAEIVETIIRSERDPDTTSACTLELLTVDNQDETPCVSPTVTNLDRHNHTERWHITKTKRSDHKSRVRQINLADQGVWLEQLFRSSYQGKGHSVLAEAVLSALTY